MISELTTFRHLAPRRRFRGKRRYFQRILREAREFALRPEHGDYWDLWHYHADWPGWGNLRWKYRLQHLQALVIVYRNIASARFTIPFQSWIYLSGRNAGEDATYLHTPNPYATEFPLPLDNVEWGHSALLQTFTQLLPGLSLRIGKSRHYDRWAEPPRVTTSFFVYSPGVGVPLERVA